MPLSSKILIFLGAILTLGLLSFIAYKQVENSTRQQAIETQVVQQKELLDNIMRSQSQYATRGDVEKFITDNGVNLQTIKDDLNKLHAEVTAVNVVTTNSTGYTGSNLPSTNTGPTNPNPQPPTVNCNGTEIPCPNANPFGYNTKQQDLSLTEDFGVTKVPLGQVGFSAWQKDPWSISILPRQYNVVSVIGTDEERRAYVYNKFTIKTGNKDYDVKITTASTQQVYPEAKFSWWNPRLFGGADAGINLTQMKGEFTPSINLGIMSYGKYTKQPDFSILQVGVGYGTVSQKPQAVITPFMYNVGKNIPFMNNTYIGPSVHIGLNGEIAIMAGLRIAL